MHTFEIKKPSEAYEMLAIKGLERPAELSALVIEMIRHYLYEKLLAEAQSSEPSKADISLYIYERSSPSETQYDVLLKGFNYELAPIGRINFTSNPKEKLSAMLQDIETGSESPTVIDNRMRSKGLSLYEELFPSGLKDFYWENRDRIRTFHVLSDEP